MLVAYRLAGLSLAGGALLQASTRSRKPMRQGLVGRSQEQRRQPLDHITVAGDRDDDRRAAGAVKARQMRAGAVLRPSWGGFCRLPNGTSANPVAASFRPNAGLAHSAAAEVNLR